MFHFTCLIFFKSEAQTVGDFRPIVALTYGLKVEKIGVNIGAEYLPLDNFGLAFTYEDFFSNDPAKFRSYHFDDVITFDWVNCSIMVF